MAEEAEEGSLPKIECQRDITMQSRASCQQINIRIKTGRFIHE